MSQTLISTFGDEHKYNLLTTREVAHMYQVTINTVLNWIHAGKLTAYTTPGGRYRIGGADLTTFAHDHNLPPVEGDGRFEIRLLFVGADVEFFRQVREIVHSCWHNAQVEYARDELEAGYWLAQLNPTHIALHTDLDSKDLHERVTRLSAGSNIQNPRLITLPNASDNTLGEWIAQEVANAS